MLMLLMQRMVCGLAASIFIMVVEMSLFIVRAIQMENTFEAPQRNLSSSSSSSFASSSSIPAFSLAHSAQYSNDRHNNIQHNSSGGARKEYGFGGVNMMDSDSEDERRAAASTSCVTVKVDKKRQ